LPSLLLSKSFKASKPLAALLPLDGKTKTLMAN
jgi:hypothetical protein